MKERVTITIERSLLKTIDASVDGIDVKNRSQAIEMLIERGLKSVMPSKAIILAGGDVRRLLTPVNAKPVLVHNIELLTKYGITDITFFVSKTDPRVKEFLGDGSKYDAQFTFIEEKEPAGTAGGLNYVRDALTEPFILLNGDDLKNVDLRSMFQFHREHHGACTIALTSVQDPSQYGVALLNGHDIIAFIEKPSKNAPSNLISAGLYIANPEILGYVQRGFSMLETDVFPKLAKEGSLIGYAFSGQYLDIQPSTPEKLTSAWKGIR